MSHYFRIWLATARYSLVRTMMFRGDFFVWSLVELFWMTTNLFMVSVIYDHTDGIAGWSRQQMILLVGTSMLIQRLLMGFFWSSIFEMGRNVRTGNFDFFVAQPGNVMFMATTRKLDPDGLINAFIAIGVIVYATGQLNLHPSVPQLVVYGLMIIAGLVIHYSILVISVSMAFWLTSAQGVEGTYFALTEFSRMPRRAFQGFVSNVLFVWLLPVVVVSNAPARLLLEPFTAEAINWKWVLGPFVFAAAWFAVAVFVFNRGLRRYTSASS